MAPGYRGEEVSQSTGMGDVLSQMKRGPEKPKPQREMPAELKAKNIAAQYEGMEKPAERKRATPVEITQEEYDAMLDKQARDRELRQTKEQGDIEVSEDTAEEVRSKMGIPETRQPMSGREAQLAAAKARRESDPRARKYMGLMN